MFLLYYSERCNIDGVVLPWVLCHDLCTTLCSGVLGHRTQRHVPCCVQRACSSTHKALLAMVLSRILQWWRLDVSSDVRLSDIRVGRRRPLAMVVAGNPRDCFFDLLDFFLQIQDNHFIPVCLLVSIYVAYCNLIFD